MPLQFPNAALIGCVEVTYVTVKGRGTNDGVDQLWRLVVEAHGCLLAPQACTESRPKTERADPIDPSFPPETSFVAALRVLARSDTRAFATGPVRDTQHPAPILSPDAILPDSSRRPDQPARGPRR